MHYYQHNIGDYRRDTSHLSLVEHGIYRQLMDSYYLDEQPLCADLAKLMRSHSVRSADEQQSLKNVLADFFELTENGYIHKRCDEVIAEYHGKSDKARASAMARWGNKHKDVDANALPTQSKRNAKGMLTNNHKPITNISTPDGVSESIFKDYLEVRKAKKAKWTETALKGLQREAGKANISLEKAMQICCERNWVGIQASWLKEDVQQVEKVKFI
jgi:uncharacterized protein YdaU (DUF1376 family)